MKFGILSEGIALTGDGLKFIREADTDNSEFRTPNSELY